MKRSSINFEVYHPQRLYRTQLPCVTITKDRISLNKYLVRKNKLGPMNGVIIMYSTMRRVIVFSFSAKYNLQINPNMLRMQSRGGAKRITAAGFFKSFNLDMEELRGHYKPQFIQFIKHNSLGGQMLIDLRNGLLNK
jgi:hypothetical protein